MFTPHQQHRITYTSIYDPAVDDASLSEEQIVQYVQTRDAGLLPLKAGCTPISWTVAPLDRYTLRYALSTCPDAAEGGKMPDILAYHLLQCGLKEVCGLPAGAPPFSLHRTGLLEKVNDDFIRAVPPEVAQELGGLIYDLSTVSEETKKKSPSPSAGKMSKSGSPAKPARRR